MSTNRAITTEVLVIGGGATGIGVARDAAMRGFDVVLVERRDLAEGTTGRYHGLLHSGGRYVVKDPSAARECAVENTVVRRIAADCVEDTGGLFVTTPWDDEAYADKFVDACHASGVEAEEISVRDALAREPRLNPDISRAFFVADAALDAWKLMWANARSAQEYGARVLTYHPVSAILRSGNRVVGATVRDEHAGEESDIHADFTINATGAWAGRIAALAGCEGVGVVPGRGIMVAMNHRLVNTVINRCTMPSDGDIIVPIRTVCVVGTTDEKVEDPDELEIPQSEVDFMLDQGEKLVVGFREARALRAWAGARPLFQDLKAPVSDTRDITRAHTLIDHESRDEIERFLTITGGKATTFRLMAEDTVDGMCRQLGAERACRTAEEPLPDSESRTYYALGTRLGAAEASLHEDQLICECELITRGKLEGALRRRPTANIDDIRRAVRLGMGPCQGGFCTYRTTGVLRSMDTVDQREANDALLNFLQERWKGTHPILHGGQLRQARLDDWIFQGLLDVEHLPR